MQKEWNWNQRREPNIGDPNDYIAEFETWMMIKKRTWPSVNMDDISDYRAVLSDERRLLSIEIIPRIQIIKNKLSEVIREGNRPHPFDSERSLFIGLESDLRQFASPGPALHDAYRDAIEAEGVRAGTLRVLKEQKMEVESGNYGKLVKQVSSPEKYLLLLDVVIAMYETDGRPRLTPEQAGKLLKMPGMKTLKGKRDTTAIALLLCTGVREAELQALTVADLRHNLAGMTALHVPGGPGCTERLVPYGQMTWLLDLVDAWLTSAGIHDGPVLRGFYRDSKRVRPGRIALRSIRHILNDYPLRAKPMRPEQSPEFTFTATPLDLRRTYASQLYSAGMDLGAIAANLGVADIRTALEYIGTTQPLEQFPPSLYWYKYHAEHTEMVSE